MVADKMVRTKWYGQNGIRTKWYWTKWVPRQFVYGYFVYDTSSTGISSTDISSTTVCLRIGQLYIHLLFQQAIIFINSNFYLHYDSFLSIDSTSTDTMIIQHNIVSKHCGMTI